MPKWFTDNPDEVWEGLDTTMRRKVDRWIGRAETIIRTKFPDIQARINAETLDVAAVSGVVEEMVDRAIDHEERGGVETEGLPEWTVGYETGSGMGKGSKLYLTTDEFALLAPKRKSRGTGSLRMRRSYEVTDPTQETP